MAVLRCARPRSREWHSRRVLAFDTPSRLMVGREARFREGDGSSCSDFSSQAEARAVLRADLRDLNRVDADHGGIACESNPPPRDTVRVLSKVAIGTGLC